MERDPRRYSRLLVLGGLLPLLLLDVAVGLPAGAFVGGSGLVLLVAAGVHAAGDQPRAAAGWLVLAVSVGLFAVVDVSGDPLYVVALVVLLLAGLVLLASERGTGENDEDGDGEENDDDGDENDEGEENDGSDGAADDIDDGDVAENQ